MIFSVHCTSSNALHHNFCLICLQKQNLFIDKDTQMSCLRSYLVGRKVLNLTELKAWLLHYRIIFYLSRVLTKHHLTAKIIKNCGKALKTNVY